MNPGRPVSLGAKHFPTKPPGTQAKKWTNFHEESSIEVARLDFLGVIPLKFEH